ncbi:hypothetical protein [Sphingomonas sp.]|jgi:hypothetical protein|uniref:hypothetical protein n=1 Tax=Sphingomonas sp. TaxID=28214 RepID=UPI002E31B0C0|nr:hypothetical protein [Sphingomonas sp.]HEX4694536.1 hypothetical protein [Sphingomonas sp.]
MSVIVLFVAFAGQTVSEPPEESRVKGSAAERSIAEFMDVCVRPRFDEAVTRLIVTRSDFAYQSRPPDPANPTSFRWRSSRAVLALELGIETGGITAQCALSIGSIQPRTGDQIAAMMKPALEAELGFTVTKNIAKDEVELDWSDKGTPVRYRIRLVGSATQPHQAQWYVLDRLPK